MGCKGFGYAYGAAANNIIQFLKLGGRFDPWVEDCLLTYQSNNALEKVDVLGSLFFSILSGHKRYAHITNLLSD
jgi:hypothetical protein